MTAYGMRISDWSSDVCSSDLSITAHGTVFDVAVVDRHVSVALLRGSIEVRRSAGQPATDDAAAARLLVPGQTLSISRTEPLQPPQLLAASRSEEHTSELQSLMRISYAVFCLKKKKNTKTAHKTYQKKQ